FLLTMCLYHVQPCDNRRSIRKRWSWNDLSDSERTTVRHFESVRRKSMGLLFLAYRFSSRT
ncbi:hypothetical protein, partial [Escherichia coli]|uniref:hypothetical protein n=1 Tax=Escherichia coli TaxID=562 RepID=UPI001BC845A3